MLTHLKYLLSFFLPVCVVFFLSTAPHSASAALLWTLPLWLLILLDWLSPKVNPQQQAMLIPRFLYEAILYGLALLQFLIIALLINSASQLAWDSVQNIGNSMINLMVMRILVGSSSGSSALVVAHELVHHSQRRMRLLGKLLLYTVCYPHFVSAHLHGHHLSVATPADIATARLNECFADYWKRVLIGHFKYAWNAEQQRLRQSNLNYKIRHHTVLHDIIIQLVGLILIFIFFGWVAVFIFLYQALSAIRLLETINYYQHWGLSQGKAKNTLAWVNQSSISDYALIGLPRHINHHQQAAYSLDKNAYSSQGPVMPYGYFVTNLWVKLNNRSYCQASTEILNNWWAEK